MKRKMMNRFVAGGFVRLAVCALLSFAGVLSAWGDGALGKQYRKVNPDFVEWQKRQQMPQSQLVEKKLGPSGRMLLSAEPDSAIVSSRLSNGLEPTLIDFSYLNDLNRRDVYGVPDKLDSRYDPREKFTLTTVRHQDPQDTGIGTCWAQASIGSMETWLAKNGYGQNMFSVKNMANLIGYDRGSNPKKPGGWFGGNHLKAASYLLRWDGPVWEKDDPYTNKYGVLNYSLTSSRLSPAYHVQQMRLIPKRTGALDNDALKRAVLEFGGLYATMQLYSPYYNGNLFYYWNNNGAYYCPETGAGHAVTLVGWDDNYSKDNFNPQCRPKGDGAFIVKDSYGVDAPRDGGYIYVSYYDTTFAYTPSCAFPLLEETSNYAKVYEYDTLGWIASYVSASSVFAANVFTSTEDGELDAVGFYAVEPYEEYTISIYTECSASNPTSGTKCITQSGTCDGYAGYYTYKLNESIKIKKGTRFSVVMKLKISDEYPLPVEYAEDGYSSEAYASAGQSFVKINENDDWLDMTKVIHATANFCCKAYTKSATAAKPTLSSLVVSGVLSLTSGKTAQFSCDALYSNGSKKSVSPTWSITEGRNYASISSSGLVTAKNVTAQQQVMVKALYKEGSVTKDATWGLYVTAGAPDKPTGVMATEGMESSCIRVTWNAPSGATEYAVYRSTANNSQNAQYLDKVTVAKFNDTSAAPGVDYWYFVKAKNASDTSDYSAGAKGWRKLSPPDNVTATDNLADKVTVKWDAADGAKAYRVYRAASIDGTPSQISGWITSTSFDDTAATAGVTYYYYVKAAVDASGTRPSDYSIIEDGKRPAPVTASKLTISGPATIESGKSAEYKAAVEYSDQSAPKDVTANCSWMSYGSAANWNFSTKKLTAKTVTSNQKVQLIAFYTENAKTIACTNDITITPVAATSLSAPSGLKVMSQTAAGVALSWNAVTGAGSYNVYRAANGETAKKIGSSNTPSFTDNTATPGVTYTYSVSAANSKGESARSSTVTGTVLLSAPTGVTATSDRTDGVNISWQPSAGATYYRVAWATSKTGTKTELGTWTTNKSYLDTSATAGTTYYYFVRAATSSGGANASGYSQSAQGMRISSGTLSSVSISGQDKVTAGQAALYTCTATYSNGKSASVKAGWTVSPTTAATIDGDGRLTAKTVSKDTDLTITASFTDGTTKTAAKTVKILAATSAQSAQVKDVSVSSRWPFAALLDIDYTLVVNPSSSKAFVSAFGRDEDRGEDIEAKTLTGDGADGSPITAGRHRLTWDIGTDYPDFHATSFSVTMNATLYTTPTYTVTYNPGANGAGSQQTATKTEDVALTLKGAIFTRTGYTQTGWATSDGGTKVYDLSASYMVNSSITLYPFWTKVYILTPLRNLLTGIEKLTPDGVLSDEELNKAMTNPHYANLDGDPSTISSAEMSIFRRIQALNTDKTLMSNVMSGHYSGISDATMEELGSISDAIKALTANR